MSVAIIDYGSGNLRSAAKAFERIGADVRITSDIHEVAAAGHIVLPGVGTYYDCMKGLTSLPGMLETLQKEVLQGGKPFLGICVGMQMLFERGHEHGVHKGLGWLEGEVVALTAQPDVRLQMPDVKKNSSLASVICNQSSDASHLKIPHMGWNDLRVTGNHPLMKNIKTGDHAYFVHSYHAVCKNNSDILATVEYGQTITAVVGRGNIMGTQFHPEKSQETGLRLLKNFLEMK